MKTLFDWENDNQNWSIHITNSDNQRTRVYVVEKRNGKVKRTQRMNVLLHDQSIESDYSMPLTIERKVKYMVREWCDWKGHL